MTRELTRCIAWAFGLGLLACAFALLADLGLAQSDGLRAGLVFAVYAPFYLVVHAMHATLTGWQEDATLMAAAAAGQLVYFLGAVAAVRYLYRYLRRPGR